MSCAGDDILLCLIDMANKLRWREFAPSGEAFHVASYQLEDSFQLNLHTHNYAEVFWITQGEGFQIGRKERQALNTGSIAIVHPECVHRFGSETSMTLVNVAFSTSVYHSLCRVFDSVKLMQSNRLPEWKQVTKNALIELNRALNELVQSPKRSIYLWRFLTRLLCMLEQVDEELPPDAPAWLAKACRLIRDPQHASGGVPEFIRLAGRSPEHVSRFTRKWTGQTPRDIVQAARLENAAQALALTDTAVIEIAADAGFQNLGHFYKVFKSRYHCPPLAYRHAQKRLPAGIML